jgi:pimeloyl-ACP methyl ester carboxylesterase
METRWTPVADGVALATDAWMPATANGSSFLLVHGLASNARMWDGVAERLVASGHPTVAVDLRGHGRSSKLDGPYDVPTVADDLANLIRELPLERPIVAGQSWGGNVVIELAARYPGLISGIVCVDGGWLEPSREFADWEACRTALAPPRLLGRRLDEVERRIRSGHPDWPESGIRGVLGNFEVRPDGTVAPWLTFDRHIAVLRGLWDHHPVERYAAVTAPVLLAPADGDASDRSRRKRLAVEDAAARLANARVQWFVGDHDIHAQHPAELATAMHGLAADGFFTPASA